MSSQINVRPGDELLEKFDTAMDRYGKKSRSEIALEILEQYFDFWAEIEEAKLEARKQQREHLGKSSLPARKKTGT